MEDPRKWNVSVNEYVWAPSMHCGHISGILGGWRWRSHFEDRLYRCYAQRVSWSKLRALLHSKLYNLFRAYICANHCFSVHLSHHRIIVTWQRVDWKFVNAYTVYFVDIWRIRKTIHVTLADTHVTSFCHFCEIKKITTSFLIFFYN